MPRRLQPRDPARRILAGHDVVHAVLGNEHEALRTQRRLESGQHFVATQCAGRLQRHVPLDLRIDDEGHAQSVAEDLGNDRGDVGIHEIELESVARRRHRRLFRRGCSDQRAGARYHLSRNGLSVRLARAEIDDHRFRWRAIDRTRPDGRDGLARAAGKSQRNQNAERKREQAMSHCGGGR